jgi:hypothetical protein
LRERYRGPREYREIQGDNRRLHDLICTVQEIPKLVLRIIGRAGDKLRDILKKKNMYEGQRKIQADAAWRLGDA